LNYSPQYTTVTRNVNNATLGLEVGNLAPGFRLTDIEQRIITRDSLKGKPTIIFFTTTWCVPCQIGAKELLKYDLETGDNKFNVVIVFVDPRETNEQIKQWKNNFGGKDWYTALDTSGMQFDYQVRYLDTKYVLDKNGIIVWKDFLPLKYQTAKNVLQPLIV
jgi:cytochrome oxidase Cu insertion factor (SCO1/SenC/PrrC family)